ncbi:MAG: hypothetical protein AAF573_18785, partial [Bacteroidota bacterium]
MKKTNHLRILLLILFLLGKNGWVFSQQKTIPHKVTSIYKITDKEAKELLVQPPDEIKQRYFHTLVDTVHGSYSTYQSISGYYLFAEARGETLKVRLEGFYSISAVVLNNSRDLVIQVIDSLGNPIRDAEVRFGKKKMKYDKKLQAFRKKRVNKGGFLTVKAEGETIFYKVEDRSNISILKKRYWRFRSTQVGWIVTTPLRWGSKVVRFFRNAIKGYGWEWWIFQRSRRRKDKSHKGYIVLNQPKYQPNDIVKVKAYLTTHKGKPLKKNVAIGLAKGHSYSKPIFEFPITQTTPGAYTYEFVLGDSLQLDQQYQIFFYYKKKPIMSHRFQYEDYQLDEVEYTFETTQKEYFKDDKIILL